MSAPVLGFDLARLQGGSAVAEVLLRGMSLNHTDLDALALSRTDEWERAALWQDVDVAVQQRKTANEATASLTVIERTPLGTLDGLLHCLRYDVLDWTWAGTTRKPITRPEPQSAAPSPTIPAQRNPRQRQSETASRATAVLSDAAAGAYLRELLPDETRRRLSTPWVSAVRQLPERSVELGPNADDVQRLLTKVGSLSQAEMLRLNKVCDTSRPGLADWAPAVHSASWAVFLAGRVRSAAAAQLMLVQAIDRAGVPVADRAGGVWNLLSGAAQALMVRDLLDSPTSRRLLDPFFTAMGTLGE